MVSGITLSAAEFGNFAAGYSGQYLGAVGYAGVRAGGVWYDFKESDWWMGTKPFDWDEDSVPAIEFGSWYAASEMEGSTMLNNCGCTK